MFNLIITNHANRRFHERITFLHSEDYETITLNAFNFRDCRPVSNKLLCDYLNYLETPRELNEIRFVSLWQDCVFIFLKHRDKNDNNIYLKTVFPLKKESVLRHAIYDALKGSKY